MDDQKVRLVCFELCGEKFAFDAEYLVEIVQADSAEITPYYTPVPVVRGTWNYRDTSLYVIDLREFFGLEGQATNAVKAVPLNKPQQNEPPEEEDQQPAKAPTKSMVIVNIREHLFGLLTDLVVQVFPFEVLYEYPDLISPLPRRYFAGITLMDAELVILLAIDKFLDDHELQSLEAIAN